MKKYNIIYISYDGMTDPLGQSQVLPYLKGLSAFNFAIDLISFEKENRFIEKKSIIENYIKGSNIHWHPLKYHQKPSVFSTLYDIWLMNKEVKRIVKQRDVSLIHCRSYISSLVGLGFKLKYKIPFIFDMRGFWADERVDGKIWDLRNPLFKGIYNYFKRKEKQFIVHSDYIISLTHNAKNEILSWKFEHLFTPKIQVIPCCADFNHFNTENINTEKLNQYREKLGLSLNDFVISYIGSLGTWYMIDEMMEFYSIANKKIKDCKFLILTTDNPEIAYKAAQKFNIDKNSIILKKADRNDMPYYIALSSFSMFFIKPAFSKKASSPTKLAEILGMGIPVICNAYVGDVEEIITKNKVGFAIRDFSSNAYREAIDNMLSFLPAPKNKIIEAAHHYASLNDGVKKYYEVYAEVLNIRNDDTTHP